MREESERNSRFYCKSNKILKISTAGDDGLVSGARVDMKYLLSEREINIGPQFDGLRFDRNISDYANEDDSDDDDDDNVVQVDFDLAGATRDGNEDDERNSEEQEKPITKP